MVTAGSTAIVNHDGQLDDTLYTNHALWPRFMSWPIADVESLGIMTINWAMQFPH